jgi:Flp pilus assembly protein TadD
MSRKLVLFATLALLAGGRAFGATPPAGAHLTPAAVPAKPAPPLARPHKATAEQRAEIERLDDPLARAAFWAREVDVDPGDAEAGVKLAKALRALGRFDEAATAADQVLVLQPNNFEALLESARARIGADQGFYAIDHAQRAETLQPHDWRPVSLLAIALEQSERDDEALAAHRKALQLAPDNPATLTNLGMYYATHGQAADAEPLLRKAASLPGATAQERQNLALVLGLQGRLDEAAQLARQDLPPTQVDNNLAYLRAANGQATAHSWQGLSAVQ